VEVWHPLVVINPSISSSSEDSSSPSSSLQFSIGDSDVDPRAVTDLSEGGNVIRGWVTSKEVSSLVNPLWVKPGWLRGVAGDAIGIG
jgi:hypothetical protein